LRMAADCTDHDREEQLDMDLCRSRQQADPERL
jgi:hypothetical protein